MELSPLKVARTDTATIPSHRYLTETGITLSAGALYRLQAEGTWTDWYIPCGPEGFADPILNGLSGPLKRAPESRLFTLMGILRGRQDSLMFEIGLGIEFIPPFDGELCCFANDVPGCYWNNYGMVNLTVQTMAAARART